MKPRRHHLHEASRDPRVLWRIVLTILLTSLVLAGIAGHFGAPDWLLTHTPNDPALIADAVAAKDWGRLFAFAAAQTYLGHSLAAYMAVGSCGIVWILILLHVARELPPVTSRGITIGMGLILGFASLIPAKVILLLSTPQMSPADGAAEYWFIARSALLGESAKLLLLLPLTPWICQRRDPLEIFAASSAVGLGFGLGENFDFASAFGSSVLLGRFVSDNFLHMVWTSFAGAAVCGVLMNRRGALVRFIERVFMVVLANVIYKLLMAGAFSGSTFYANVVLVFAGVLYFQELHAVRGPGPQPISPIATFAIGSASMTGLFLILPSAIQGFSGGMASVSLVLLSFALLNFLFIKELSSM